MYYFIAILFNFSWKKSIENKSILVEQQNLTQSFNWRVDAWL